MARKHDIQYVRFYTDGSSARVLKEVASAPKTRLPKVRKKRARVIRLDPLAFLGIAVSAVMLVLMVVSCFQLTDYQKKAGAMDSYVEELRMDNARLKAEYHGGYDLQDVHEKALALGMVPVEDVKHITVSVADPDAPVNTQTEGSRTFLTELFD